MGVYISYPFCAQKCTYCNFASGVLPRELESPYREALKAEIGSVAWTSIPETVYLGGGTPSTIAASDLPSLLDLIPGRPWKEATIEAAPGTLSRDMVRAWVDSGINRVSLGVQSFIEKELRLTGRRHTAQTVASDIDVLRAGGIESISIDLIAGLSGQTARTWEESLAWVEHLRVPHVSVYMLEVDDDSRLGREMMLGGVRYGAGDTPSEEGVVEFYQCAVQRLQSLGLARYEISNFAAAGYASVHNLKYWKLEPYLGFGSDAHSFDGKIRWQNVETAQEYVQRWRAGSSPRLSETSANLDEEHFFVGLRLTAGIVPSVAERERFRAPIHNFLQDGLLEESQGRLRLSDRGVLLSNEVLAEFVGA